MNKIQVFPLDRPAVFLRRGQLVEFLAYVTMLWLLQRSFLLFIFGKD